MSPAQAQQQVDEAVQVLLARVRAIYPLDAAVTVKSGQGSFSGTVCGPAKVRGHEVQVQVQRDYDAKSTRRSRPRWHCYRSVWLL